MFNKNDTPDAGISKIAAELISNLTGIERALVGYFALGDKHHGKSVGKIDFTGGQSYIVKPRSVSGEFFLQKIEEFIFSDLSINAPINRVLVANQKVAVFDYIEFDEVKDLDRYFYLCGVVGLLLFCLLATDVGYENVVCSEDAPVVIDSETLFSPNLVDLKNGRVNYSLRLDYCLISRTGFFPSKYIFSPLINSRQLSMIEHSGDEDLAKMIRRFPLCDQGSQLIWSGWCDALSSFRRLLSQGLFESILQADGFDFRDLRVFLRPTFEYIEYLNGGRHSEQGFHEFEISQLRMGDIPYFTHNSLALNTSIEMIVSGVEAMTDFAEKNTLFTRDQISRLLVG